jgi:hypothetical protein
VPIQRVVLIVVHLVYMANDVMSEVLRRPRRNPKTRDSPGIGWGGFEKPREQEYIYTSNSPSGTEGSLV